MRKIFLAVLFLAASSAFAQTKGFFGLSGGVSTNSGYKYLTNAKLGIENKNFELYVDGGSTPKYGPNDGFSYGGGAIGILPLGEHASFRVRGAYGKIVTSDWSKSHLQFDGGLGMKFSPALTAILWYQAPPVKLDTDFWVYGPAFALDMRFRPGKKWELQESLSADHFHSNTSAKWENNVEISVGFRRFF